MKLINSIKNKYFQSGGLIDKLAIISITLFVLECSLGGSGRWLALGPLSLRYLLFAFSFLLLLPSAFRNLKKLFHDNLFWSLFVFVGYILFSTLVGYLTRNKLSFIITDLTGLLAVVLLIPVIAFDQKAKLLKFLTDAIIWGSFALAVVVFILHLLLSLPYFPQNEVNMVINNFNLGGLANIGYDVVRIYLRSEIFYQFAIVLCVLKIYLNNKADKKWLIYAVALGTILFALLLTFTRAFWLGSMISLSLLLVFALINKDFLRLARRGIAAFLIFFVLFGISCAAYRSIDLFNAVVGRVEKTSVVIVPGDNPDTNIDKEDDANKADRLRVSTLIYTQKNIMMSPVFGLGLGKNLDGIRTDGRSEYVYWDMAMKIGILGVGFMILPYVMLIGTTLYLFILRKKASKSTQNAIFTAVAFCAGFIGLLLTSYFNPFITNPLGISLILCTIVSVCHAKETYISDTKEAK